LVQAGERFAAVANDVAQAYDLIALLALGVGKHRLESFEVAVDVTDDGATQLKLLLLWRQALAP